MVDITRGQLLQLNNGTEVTNAIAARNGPLPITAYVEGKGQTEIKEGDYKLIQPLDDKFPDFVHRVSEEIKQLSNQLGESLWQDLKQEGVEQLLDIFFDYLDKGYDVLEAGLQAAKEHSLNILTQHANEIAEIIQLGFDAMMG